MKSFGYAIWFLPSDNYWNQFTCGFHPHVTIICNLSYSEARHIYSMIHSVHVDIELNNNPILYFKDNFGAMYYNVNIKEIKNYDGNIIEKPKWWPDDAHMSFIYEYNNPITKEQISKIPSFSYSGQLSEIALVDCSEHYSEWKIIKKKSY
tara:strand:- start:8701 stop:9150 length:450 start_codon:yes stop_codon:yes gene_type:complete